MKVVAIEDGLEDIGKYLSAMGYKTVAWVKQIALLMLLFTQVKS